jgi:D-serine deaminase-like pyridoxal phosphate-dependent protein
MEKATRDWFTINKVQTLDTPAFVVYPARVLHNIEQAKRIIGDVSRLRPHVKTHKSPDVTLMLLQAGIKKFKCATIAEAEMLAQCKAPDVLLAYQPVGPKIDRLLQLIKNYPETTFSCLVDNSKSAEEIAVAALNNNVNLNVYIDLNVGMNRTGIAPGKEALQLYLNCLTKLGIRPVGLHAYDGHIHDADLSVRESRSDGVYNMVSQLKQDLIDAGIDEPQIIIGGSPTFLLYAKRGDVECSPGTFVYWDANYQRSYPEQPFLPAALVITRVVSKPALTLLCLDLGHKAVAAENSLDKRVSFLNAPNVKIISQSEEHIVIDAGENHSYEVGDLFYGLPYHICPTCALYERAVTIENEEITGEWLTIARNRKINF